MIAGCWRDQEVIVFTETKHFMGSTSPARSAISQLYAIKLYWEELQVGNLEEWIAKGEVNKVQAYSDLKVSMYGDRPLYFAIGARGYAESVKKYFRHYLRHNTDMILLTRSLQDKFVILQL